MILASAGGSALVLIGAGICGLLVGYTIRRLVALWLGRKQHGPSQDNHDDRSRGSH